VARYRLRRELAVRALELVRSDPKRGVAVIPEGENGITTDAVLILLAVTNKVRDAHESHHAHYDLRALVRQVCNRAPFDRARRYAYEVVLMRYYSLLSQFAARLRRKKSKRTKARKQEPEKPFTLVAA